MSDTDTPKKRPRDRNDYPAGNWHAADVQAEIRKAGWTFRRLAKHHGYTSVWITKALYESAPMAEGIIADAIGVHPKEIWPTRSDHAGNPKAPIKRGRVVPKNIPPRAARHVSNGGAL